MGVGGSGNNTITRLYDLGVQGAELIAMNTDAQALKHAKAHKKLLLGKDLTQERVLAAIQKLDTVPQRRVHMR